MGMSFIVTVLTALTVGLAEAGMLRSNILWSTPVSDGLVSTPVVANVPGSGATVFTTTGVLMGTKTFYVSAFNATNGALLWRTSLTQGESTKDKGMPPVVYTTAKQTLLFCGIKALGSTYVVDANTGGVEVAISAGGSLVSMGVVDTATDYYMTYTTAGVRVTTASTQALVATVPIDYPFSVLNEDSPVVYMGELWIPADGTASRKACILSVNLRTFAVTTRATLQENVRITTFTMEYGIVYITTASTEFALVAVNASSGATVWSTSPKGCQFRSVTVSEGVVVYTYSTGCTKELIGVRNALSGAVLWNRPGSINTNPATKAIVHRGTVLFGQSQTSLLGYTMIDGVKLYNQTAPWGVSPPAAFGDYNTIFGGLFDSPRNELIAVELLG